MDQLMAVIVLDNEGAGGIRVDRRKILTEVRVERTGAAGIEAEVFLFGFSLVSVRHTDPPVRRQLGHRALALGERQAREERGQSDAELTIALAHEEHVILRAVVAVHVVDDPSAGQTRQIGFGRIVRHSFAPFPHDVRAYPGQTLRHTHMHRRRG